MSAQPENATRGTRSYDVDVRADAVARTLDVEPEILTGTEHGEEAVREQLDAATGEGRERLDRSWRTVLATGAVGGIDIGLGLLAFYLVADETGSHLLGALAFGIGFVALTFANSELFTENFLVPIVAWARDRNRVGDVARLWVGTLFANLVAGWVMAGVITVAFPELREKVLEAGRFYVEQGIGARSFALAVLGGAVITLFTWMMTRLEDPTARVLIAAMTGFLLLAGPLNHSVVGSLELFGALQFGADFGYADWAGMAAWMVLGNAAGGVGFITLTRLVQGGHRPAVDLT